MYKRQSPFSEGFAAVGGLWHSYLDRSGAYLFPLSSEDPVRGGSWPFSEGFGLIRKGNGSYRYNYVDRAGNQLLETDVDGEASSFSEGLAFLRCV